MGNIDNRIKVRANKKRCKKSFKLKTHPKKPSSFKTYIFHILTQQQIRKALISFIQNLHPNYFQTQTAPKTGQVVFLQNEPEHLKLTILASSIVVKRHSSLVLGNLQNLKYSITLKTHRKTIENPLNKKKKKRRKTTGKPQKNRKNIEKTYSVAASSAAGALSAPAAALATASAPPEAVRRAWRRVKS